MLMPKPKNINLQSGKYLLTKDFTLNILAPQGSRSFAAGARFLRRLSGRTGLFFTQDFTGANNLVPNAPCVFRSQAIGKTILGEDETYTLTVTPSNISLNANTDFGILRGMETLLQLLQSGNDGYYFPACTVDDAPRFPWRGLMIDGCRHFMPLDVILRNIDAIAAVKMNVFHWHLSEDQGFRVECRTFPKLHELGSDGLYYTQEQIRYVIRYADERGIRVVPEFDIPGHSTSWLVAFPELGSAPGPYTIERRWGVFDPVFNPTIEATYEFFDKFFAEMCALFPDEYMHIGGDENNGKHWSANKDIQDFIQKNGLKDNHGLQAHFNKRILAILTKYNKKMMGWDEILHPDLPKNVMIHSWRGPKYLGESAKQGYMGILSNGYYIDHCSPASFHYSVDPHPDSLHFSDEQKAMIKGGEATMWAELVTPENVDSRIWPRTAAIAERLWSPASVKDVDDMYNRLAVVSRQLEEHGITHMKNYDMMLRRIAGSDKIDALKSLADVLEPIKKYDRHRQQSYRSYSPYTRVVDAAHPESNTGRVFTSLVKEYLAGEIELAGTIEFMLGNWESLPQDLRNELPDAAGIREVLPQAELVSKLAACGTNAMMALRTRSKLSAAELDAAQTALDAAKKPAAETMIMITAGIEQLVNKVK